MIDILTKNPQARIAAAILGVFLWLAPAAGVWLYMTAKVDAAHALGVAETKAANAEAQTETLSKAIYDARMEWKRAQSDLDTQAKRDAQRIADTLTAAQNRATSLHRKLADYAKANPLPADCRADPGRIRLWNDARRGDAAETRSD